MEKKVTLCSFTKHSAPPFEVTIRGEDLPETDGKNLLILDMPSPEEGWWLGVITDWDGHDSPVTEASLVAVKLPNRCFGWEPNHGIFYGFSGNDRATRFGRMRDH